MWNSFPVYSFLPTGHEKIQNSERRKVTFKNYGKGSR
jgi:hypothetical protein